MSHHPAYSMAGLCTVGGIMAFASAKSKASLIAGLSLGTLYAISGYLIQQNKDYGVELATGTSLALTAAMGRRAIKTRKGLPVGLLTVGSISSGYYGLKLYQQYNGV